VKKTSSQHSSEISAQVPAGVTISFKEDITVNPSQFIVIKGVSDQNPAQADNVIRGLLTTLLAEL